MQSHIQKWWNNLGLEKQFYKVIEFNELIDGDRTTHPSSLNDKDIESIHKADYIANSKFKLDNQEIRRFLLTRDWLTYSHTTRTNSGWFFPNGYENSSDSSENGYPISPGMKLVSLNPSQGSLGNTSQANVMFKIWGYNKDETGLYEIEVFFYFGRGEVEYEKVCHGFIADIYELLIVLRQLGIELKHLM